jgi:hypothetical protein
MSLILIFIEIMYMVTFYDNLIYIDGRRIFKKL